MCGAFLPRSLFDQAFCPLFRPGRGALCSGASLANPEPDRPFRPMLQSIVRRASCTPFCPRFGASRSRTFSAKLFLRFCDQLVESCASENFRLMSGAFCSSALSLAIPDPDWPYRPTPRSLFRQVLCPLSCPARGASCSGGHSAKPFVRFFDQFVHPSAAEPF